jgi:hypothetical protein
VCAAALNDAGDGEQATRASSLGTSFDEGINTSQVENQQVSDFEEF